MRLNRANLKIRPYKGKKDGGTTCRAPTQRKASETKKSGGKPPHSKRTDLKVGHYKDAERSFGSLCSLRMTTLIGWSNLLAFPFAAAEEQNSGERDGALGDDDGDVYAIRAQARRDGEKIRQRNLQ